MRKQARCHGALHTAHRHYQVWRKLQRTNLDKGYPFLATIYSPNQGRLARPPTCMLRSYMAMMECGVTSVNGWVSMMRDDVFYAIISGFDPADTPGVGTFYDFQDHLLHRLRQGRTCQRPSFHRRTQRDKAEYHKDKNGLCPHRDIVNRLANRLLARSANAPTCTSLSPTMAPSSLPRPIPTARSSAPATLRPWAGGPRATGTRNPKTAAR